MFHTLHNKLTKSSCTLSYRIISSTGRRSGHRLPYHDIRRSHLLLHVHAIDTHQTLDCKVDHVHLHVGLLDLPRGTVLPRVLHPHPDRHRARPGRCSNVEREVQVSYSGELLVVKPMNFFTHK